MTLHDEAPESSYSSGMDDLTISGEISKVDDERRQVFGWASVTEINGEPVVDLQNDYVDTYEIEKAAYDYVLNSRVGGEMHRRVKKSKDAPKQVSTLIESMVLTPEKIEKMGLPPETPRGWWIGFQIPKDESGDEVWKSVKDGKYNEFSIHGMGKRKSVEKSEIGKAVLQRSEEEIRGWLGRMAQTAGVPVEELASDLVAYLDENDIDDPDDDDLHEFMVSAYGSGNVAAGGSVKKFLLAKAYERASTRDEFIANVDEIAKALTDVSPGDAGFFESIHKHLIGNHDQKDHDPKKGKFHSREQHGTKADTGRLSDTQRRGRLNPFAAAINPASAVGAMDNTTLMFRNNWGRKMPLMDNTQVFESDAASVASRGGISGGPILGLPAAALGGALGSVSDRRREQRGDKKIQTFSNTKKNLTEGQREVLEKYLGPLEGVSKKIEERGGKFVVLSESGKVLGTHDSKDKAARQLAAVEANKDH